MKKIERVLDGFVLVVASIASILMITVVFAQVVFRYCFNNPLYWSEECARYCFVYIVFCGGAWAGKEYSHLGVDFLVSKLHDRSRGFIQIIVDFLIIVFSIIIVCISISMLPKLASQKTPAIGLPMCIPYLSIPIGFSLMLFYYLLHFIEHIKAFNGSKHREA